MVQGSNNLQWVATFHQSSSWFHDIGPYLAAITSTVTALVPLPVQHLPRLQSPIWRHNLFCLATSHEVAFWFLFVLVLWTRRRWWYCIYARAATPLRIPPPPYSRDLRRFLLFPNCWTLAKHHDSTQG